MELPEIKLTRAEPHAGEVLGTKLGGTPEWVQAEWKPACCGQAMTFLSQIDSLDLPDARLPDSALIYVYFCSKCFATTSQLQSC